MRVIAIDGPAGAGKSTVAKRLASILQCAYLDTGAMYRALTLKALRQGINLDDEDKLVELANKTSIDLEGDFEKLKVFLDGEDVSEEIRTLNVTNHTFYVARAPRVREIMVRWQRSVGSKKSVVVEGRDVTTVVFPNAYRKFYLDGNVEERAKRRIKELEAKGQMVDAAQLLKDVQERDEKDLTRKYGALKKADDAIYIDSTPLTAEQVVEEMLKHIKN
ncbi:MAG: (d)CMP kinase [Candidatus Omnitrophica bacterium]|nr:(d)CMP kinase [Candidatus Omnitrophota bacterium]